MYLALASLFVFQFMLGFVLLFATLNPFNVVLLIITILVIGMLLGYFFRTAIGRDLSQFQISAIVKHLDAYAETAAHAARSEVVKLSTDLKKLA